MKIPYAEMPGLSFLSEKGKITEFIKEKRWEDTALGPIENWPRELYTGLGIIMHSGLPMCLFWGKELLFFYNEPFSSFLEKNIDSLGAPAQYVWQENWKGLEAVLGNYTIGHAAVFPQGNKEVAATFYSSPLQVDPKKIGGVLVTCIASALQKPEPKKQNDLNHLKHLAEESPVATSLFYGEDFLIELANPEALKLWGKDASVIGKKLTDAIPELIGQPYLKIIQEVLHTGITYEGKENLAYLEKEGKLIPIYTTFIYKAIHNAAGIIDRILCIGYDVTDQVLTRNRVLETEASMRMALDYAMMSTFDVDLTSDELVISEELTKIFAFPAGTVKRKDFLSVIHPSDLHLITKAFEELDATAKLNADIRIIWPDDSIHWIKIIAQYLYNTKGVPERILGIVQDITDRKEAEEIMSMHGAIIKFSDDAIISKKLDGTITSWNHAAEKIFGYTAAEMIGQQITKIIPTDRLNEEPMIVTRIKAGELVEHFEAQRLTKDERLIDLSLTISPIKDSRGNIIGASKIARDITLQKSNERLISENEERLKIVVEASEMGTWGLEIKTRTVSYSKRYLEIFGYTGDEEPSHTELLNALHPDDVSLRNKAFIEAYKTGILAYTAKILWKDGSVHWIEIKGKIFYSDNGEPEKATGVIRDVTEERHHRQILEENEKKFRLLANSMPQHVWTSDAGGQLNYFNQSVFDYSGLSPEEIFLKGWLEIVHPEERDENIRQWTYAIKTGNTFLFEHRFRRHDGEYRWQLSRAVPHRDSEGKIQIWIGTSTDIHEQKTFAQELETKINERTRELVKINEQLKKSNHDLEQFAYIASHDLQEPLRKIQTFSNLLQDHADNPSMLVKYNHKISSSAQRMSILIKDVLNYSRLTQTTIDFSPTDLNEILDHIKTDFELLMEEKNAVINHSHLPVIEAMPLQISQLFSNLVSNALKFSANRPQIDISSVIMDEQEIRMNTALNPAYGYHHIIFRDNGIGFDQQYAEQIFTIFQRLNDKTAYSGTGIGLALCKKIVENHRGYITAESEINKGTTFHVYLPFKKEQYV